MVLEKMGWRGSVRGRLTVVLLAVALFCGCASFGSRSNLPPITAVPTGESVIGKFVWFDLLTEDAVAARSFYGQLFGWEFDASQGPSDYSLIQHRGQPIGGVAEIPGELEGSEGIWLASISVSDVDRAARLAEELGGEVLDDPLLSRQCEFEWQEADVGRRVASGTYFYRLEAGSYSETKRMVLVK